LLQVQGVTKAFYGVPVLKGVDFDVQAGEVHVLLGENGAGKSTLMKILSGAYSIDGGAVLLDGKALPLDGYTPRAAEDLGIVTVYQNFHLIPHLTVAENASLGLFARERGRIRWRKVYAHAEQMLARIHFNIDLRKRVKDLPVSQKQMLEIAIALSKNARLLIMDEPTAALSPKEVDTLFATIGEIKAQGVGIIYISHKLEEVKRIGDRITVLRDGQNVATLPARDADLQQVISLMIGKSLAQRTGDHGTPIARATLMQVEGLTGARFPEPVSLTLREGESLGVTGLVGAGKTELSRLLFGVDRPSGGAITYLDKKVEFGTPRRAIGLGLGYLPEDRDAHGLCLNMPVKDNITLVHLAKLRTMFFSPGSEKQRAGSIVQSFNIRTAGLTQHVKYLSGGNKQKVVFGKWLSARCNVLLLDEPTVGIDVGARGEIYELVRAFVTEAPQRAVIIFSSDMDEVLEIADRILVLAGGRIAAELDPRTATKQQVMEFSVASAVSLAALD
ncbi:MAG: sugar ABC transporter ATP-binding protein, partial [Caldilineaceae bacterium]